MGHVALWIWYGVQQCGVSESCGGGLQVPAPKVQQLALHSLDDRLGRPRSAKVRRMRTAHSLWYTALYSASELRCCAFPFRRSASGLSPCRKGLRSNQCLYALTPSAYRQYRRAQTHPLHVNGVRSARSWQIVRDDCLLPEVVSCPELADSVSHVGLWMSGGGALPPEPSLSLSLSRWPPSMRNQACAACASLQSCSALRVRPQRT